nr:odorant binding protein 10 [Pachyrhinus yasumatsui]
MAKIVFVILSVLLIAGVSGTLSPEVAHKIIKIATECMKDWGLDNEIVFQLMTGEFPEDKAFKEFGLCFTRKTGSIDEQGILQRDVIKQNIELVVKDREEVKRIMKSCVIQMDVPLETAYHMGKCLHREYLLTFL